jgi:hypothetical protein
VLIIRIRFFDIVRQHRAVFRIHACDVANRKIGMLAYAPSVNVLGAVARVKVSSKQHQVRTRATIATSPLLTQVTSSTSVIGAAKGKNVSPDETNSIMVEYVASCRQQEEAARV